MYVFFYRCRNTNRNQSYMYIVIVYFCIESNHILVHPYKCGDQQKKKKYAYFHIKTKIYIYKETIIACVLLKRRIPLGNKMKTLTISELISSSFSINPNILFYFLSLYYFLSRFDTHTHAHTYLHAHPNWNIRVVHQFQLN